MPSKRYGAICPISHACKVVEPRWTIHVLTELWAGSTRFNDIRRGVGNISPGLLSKRLKELEVAGMVDRIENKATGTVDYFRTQKAIDLEPALNALGVWAQQNIAAEIALCDTDVSALMWKLRREIHTEKFPAQRVIFQFHFNDENLARDTFWIVFYPGGERDLCVTKPSYDINLYIETDLVSLGGILTGRTNIGRELENGSLFLSGDTRLARTMNQWLPFSYYIDVEGIVPLRAKNEPHAERSGDRKEHVCMTE
ncbi:winged helix-turn-helix transcriptional regulator [Pseudohalocynthiibacter aestuariivivens]|uniref:Winged helix-turn-helix transcriptional regulator n=1 Tax=Pseudohalocynthiibacter aestuariivivens TaxID=1591409 RepID=A0ABV5JCA3_9RHOB|nr:helix-turn-helix domain-containing protein [Pseudohalocynthiibacter aestuariivivens]MBS9718890.1 helix-turn-helix transcriptional regulator [Pseudohalocynthiibacter aestuariivivens]